MDQNLKDKIIFLKNYPNKINIMEVCGTHTVAISKFGIRNILNKNINLISGPGCPVCVTPDMYIDYIFDLALKEDIIIATYGDMIRVPGSKMEFTLERAKALGGKVKIVYSSVDVLNIAKNNPDKSVVFLGIGFETTTPASSVLIEEAERLDLENVYLLSLHKLVEPVMRTILEDETLNIKGFLCPGHVALILGERGFDFLREYDCYGVITGFGLEDIIEALYELIINIENKKDHISNCYKKLIKPEGNIYGAKLMMDVFDTKDDYWRGLGIIKDSGLKLKAKFSNHDIEKIYPMNIKPTNNNKGCQCGEVLTGKIKPNQCKLFSKVCTPEYPVGPCMVSSEGSCAAYYKYLT
jgi:hydrogenase expression/formation protein HypD